MQRASNSLLFSLTAPKFVEQDEWFENAKNYLQSLEIVYKGLLKGLESLVKTRTGSCNAL